jgi:hypothetical protein
MIRFRAVDLEVISTAGPAGFRTTFDSSRLVVVQGDNSVGKSLLIQSLVYALGLEGMFGPGHHYGLLTRAMSDAIDLDGTSANVLSSSIRLELENDRGEVITVRRSVRVPDKDDTLVQLVMVAREPAITGSTTGSEEAYYVRRPGAAQNERGFHRFLTEFIGWDLPTVERYEGGDSLLYLELLAPFFIVEQKAGWAGVVPRLPSYLRVRDPLARGVEFILGLADGGRSRQSELLAVQERELRARYTESVATLIANARLHGADVLGVPANPPAGRGDGPGDLAGELRVLVEGNWQPVDEVLTRLDEVLTEATTEPSVDRPTSDSRVTAELEEQLAAAVKELGEVSANVAALEETADMVNAQLGALQSRIQHVEDERRRYQELKTLVGLGSPVVAATIARNDCPTCHQSLVGVEHVHGEALDYDASIGLLSQQLATLQSLQAQAQKSADEQDAVRTGLDQQSREVRARIRALRSDLVAPESMPSVAQLQARLAAGARSDTLRALRDQVIVSLEELREIVSALDAAIRRRHSLAAEETSAAARERYEAWQAEFRSRLRALRFSTLDIDEITLDESGKPAHAGYDIAFQGSASDVVRLQWAYLVSLMAVSAQYGGNHPGVLLLDEPRQQEVDTADLRTFLQSVARLSSGQVIVATSEPAAPLRSWVDGESALVIPVDGPLLSLRSSE